MSRVADASGVKVLLVTVGDHALALSMARALVDERLAACVNVVPGLTSVYRWRGKVCEDPESLMVIKTARARVEALTRRVKELHPYECPEVLALGPEQGIEPYLRWVEEETA